MRAFDVELVREALVAFVDEMRANMIYSSFSSVIYEGHDFSCCLMSARGEQLAMGRDDHPLHMLAVPASTLAILDLFRGSIAPGDAFLHNDPYTGGTHLNDLLMLYPVFVAGELNFFAAVRAHWNDVGGMTPGSLSGRVSEIYQEGVRVPPVRIINKGRENTDLLNVLFANMRVETERRGDFNAMVGTCRKAAARIARLAERFGTSVFNNATAEILRRSEASMRRRIGELPDGAYLAEGYVESNGHTVDPLVIRLKLEIANTSLRADFTGTSPQTAGPTNVGPAMARNAVFTIVKSFLDPKVPINQGSFMPIEVFAPEGSFINARLPAPVGGMAEVKFAIDSTVAAALAQAIPEQRVGDLKGTANHMHIGGRTDSNARTFIFYEWPAGGTGASKGRDGNNAVRTYTEGDFNSIQSVEAVEASMPLRIERCCIRSDSCGDGQYRGGFGLVREVRILSENAALSTLSDRNIIPPYGVNGGTGPWCNRFTVVRGETSLAPSAIPGKTSGFELRRGDLVRIETAGGGGYGDPLKRDPDLVRRDVRNGYLTAGAAANRYGVTTLEDQPAGVVVECRRALRNARHPVRLTIGGIPREATRRVVGVASNFAKELSITDGDLVEIVPDLGVPLRAWVSVIRSLPSCDIALDAEGLRILALPEGSLGFIRVLRREKQAAIRDQA